MSGRLHLASMNRCQLERFNAEYHRITQVKPEMAVEMFVSGINFTALRPDAASEKQADLL